MRTQFQNLTRAALAAAWMLIGDPIDGARALLGHTGPAEPAAVYDASAVDPGFPGGERALLAKFDWPSDRPERWVLSIAQRVGTTSERALLGR
ncbi:MAG: hypothetical protein ACREOF_09215 [Gemmatimonadales bacterium]